MKLEIGILEKEVQIGGKNAHMLVGAMGVDEVTWRERGQRQKRERTLWDAQGMDGDRRECTLKGREERVQRRQCAQQGCISLDLAEKNGN